MQTMRQCWAVRSPGCARPTAMSSPVAVPPQGELLRRPHRRVAQAAAAAGGSGPEGRGNSSSSSSGAGGSRRAAAPAAGSVEQEEVLKLVALLPLSVRQSLEQHPQLPQLLEVVMDLGRVPIARFPGGDQRLSEAVVTAEDLQYAVDQVRGMDAWQGALQGHRDETANWLPCIQGWWKACMVCMADACSAAAVPLHLHSLPSYSLLLLLPPPACVCLPCRWANSVGTTAAGSTAPCTASPASATAPGGWWA